MRNTQAGANLFKHCDVPAGFFVKFGSLTALKANSLFVDVSVNKANCQSLSNNSDMIL